MQICPLSKQYEYVCCNCGDIIGPSDVEFNGLPDSEAFVDNLRNKDIEASSRLTGRIRNETNSSGRDKQIYRKKILADARKTVQKLVKDTNSVEEIMTMLERALDNLRRTSSAGKSALIGSSIYIISKKNDLGITICDICKSLDIKLKSFNKSLRHIKHTDPQDFDSKSDIYEGCIKSIMRKPVLNSLEPTGKYMMEKKIKLILLISEKMNAYSQRSPQCIVPAATYLAWKSTNMFETLGTEHDGVKRELLKSDISFTKFCVLIDVKKTNRMSSLTTELTSLIMKLAIPFCNIEKRKDLNYLLDCIIENSPALLEEHLTIKANSEGKFEKTVLV